tara:strand:+ start:1147 stop:1389 length:243 start_codon:yes stop_codon:yes gene_type:complete
MSSSNSNFDKTKKTMPIIFEDGSPVYKKTGTIPSTPRDSFNGSHFPDKNSINDSFSLIRKNLMESINADDILNKSPKTEK